MLHRATLIFALCTLALTGGLFAATPDAATAPAAAADATQLGCPAADGAEASLVPDFQPAGHFPIPIPIQCGENVCAPGQYCCNPSCGVCANRGDYCLDIVCPPAS